jgi:hypothetical protein
MFFPHTAGSVTNPVCSQKFSACGGPKLMTPPPVALPQNMGTSRKITFSNQTTKCVHMALFGGGKKLKIKNLKKQQQCVLRNRNGSTSEYQIPIFVFCALFGVQYVSPF